MIHESARQYTHETGKHNETRLKTVDYAGKRQVKIFTISVGQMRQYGGRYPRFFGASQAERVGFIRDYRGDSITACACRLDKCLQITAAARDQDDDRTGARGVLVDRDVHSYA